MIYLVFGASCAGKSTFIKNTWFNTSVIKDEQYYVCPYTITDKAILIGRYLTGIGAHARTVGGDRTARTVGNKLRDFVLFCIENYPNKDIVIDGFKPLTKKSVASIIDLGEPITMLYITCSTDISIKRNLDNNTTVKMSTLMACQTKAQNYFDAFRGIVYKSIYISTDNMTWEDLKRFSLSTIKKEDKRKALQLTMFEQC